MVFGALAVGSAADDDQSPSPSAGPPRTYTPAQHAAAQRVVEEMKGLATIEFEDPHWVVTFKPDGDPGDDATRLALFRAFADADAVLSGRTRNIYFYDVRNRQIGQADPLNGVRLKD